MLQPKIQNDLQTGGIISNTPTNYYIEENNFINANCSSCYENKYLRNEICVDTYENGYTYYNPKDNNTYCTTDYSCQKVFNELIAVKKQCFDNYKKNEFYQYEFRKECHQECPHNISEKSEIKNFIVKQYVPFSFFLR